MLQKKNKLLTLLEKVMWIYLFVNPFIDIFTGVYIREILDATELDVYTSTFSSTPGMYLRMLMLAVFTIYVLLKWDKKAIGTLVAMGAAWVMSIAVLMLRGAELSLGTDIKYFVKYAYNIVMLFAYILVFYSMYTDKKLLLSKLRILVTYTCLVYSLGIIIPYILGLGFSTYADRLGYRGCRGYFYSGNDVTAVFVVLLPLSIANVLTLDTEKLGRQQLGLLLAPAVGLVSMFLIGSKTAFLGAGAGTIALIVYCLVCKKSFRRKYIRRMLAILLAAVVVFGLLILIAGVGRVFGDIDTSMSATKKFAKNENVNTAIFSGRTGKLFAQMDTYLSGGPITWLFGIGRSTVEMVIEMDVFEVIIYYGIIGACAMLWVYLKLAVDFLKQFFMKFDATAFALFLGIGLTAGYMFIAGHVLFSVTSGQYFLITILLSRIYFSESRDELPLKLKKQ